MIMIYLVFMSFLWAANEREDIVYSTILTGTGNYGLWQTVLICPDGSWVRSFRHKTDINEGVTYDDVGTVLVEISCFNLQGNSLQSFISNVDMEGSTWSDLVMCSKNNNFLIGISLKTYIPETSVAGVKVKCSDESILIPGNEYRWGSYNDFGECPAESAICGIQSKFQEYQGKLNEDTALNGLNIFCCRTCAIESGRYIEKTSKQCLKCHYTCKTCFGASSSECLSCYHFGIVRVNPSSCSSPYYEQEIDVDIDSTPSNWIAMPSSIITNCGSFSKGIFGGYPIFNTKAYSYKSYTSLPPHFKKRLRLRFLKIDDMANSYAIVFLDSTIFTSKLFNNNDGLLSRNLCGGSGYEYDYVMEGEMIDNKQNFIINITADITTSSAYWGFSEFFLSIHKCHPSCASCLNESESSCTSCYPKGILSSGKCSCSEQYYLLIYQSCKQTPCSECAPCVLGCKTCKGKGDFDCKSCLTDYYLSSGYCYLKSCPTGKFGNSDSNTCDDSCKYNDYYLDIVDNLCKKCHSSCQTCTGKLITNCLSCTLGLYFFRESPEKPYLCMKMCDPPDFFYFPTRNCLKICTSPTWGRNEDRICNDKCLTSNQYVDLVARVCKLCHSTCSKCSGPLESECTSCNVGFYYFQGNCLTKCPQGFYYNSTTADCQACDKNCRTCESPDGSEYCLTCPINKFLKNNKCIESDCAKNEYKDYTANNCLPCHQSCYSCFGSSANDCLECSDKLLFNEEDNSCVLECPSFYYAFLPQRKCVKVCPQVNNLIYLARNETKTCEENCSSINEYPNFANRTCISCHPSCQSCFGPNDDNCYSCGKNLFLMNYRCLNACGIGFYEDQLIATCQKCAESCKTCIAKPDTCLTCAENSKLFLQDGKCASVCGQGYFLWYDHVCRPCESQEICIRCHESCKTCNGNTEKHCLSCPSLFYMQSNECVSNCSKGFFKKGNECVPCLEAGEYGDPLDGLCKKCPQNCSLCNYKGCIKCSNNMFLPGDWRCTSTSKYSCAICRVKFDKCIQCDDNQCLNCRTGYYLSAWNSEPNCLTCLHETMVIIGERCHLCESLIEGCVECNNNQTHCSKCSKGYALSETSSRRICKLCTKNWICPCNKEIKNCRGCFFENSAWACTKCDDGYYLSDLNEDKIYNFCVRCLDPYTYRKDGICYNCGDTIEGCLFCDGNPANCSKCSKGYYKTSKGENYLCSKCLNKNETLDQLEEFCHPCEHYIQGCLLCVSNQRCQECNPGLFKMDEICFPDCFSQNKQKLLIEQKICVESCEEGYFDVYLTNISQTICRKCDPICKTCRGQADSCISCKEGDFLLGTNCIHSCPDGYFNNTIQRRCSKCLPDQLEIIGADSKFECSECQKPCSTCLEEKNRCTSCGAGLFLYQDICQKDCPPGTFQNKFTGICELCDQTCKECFGSGNHSCSKCKIPLFFYRNQCFEECPGGFYGENETQTCNKCHFSCFLCNGAKSNDCLEPCFFERSLEPSEPAFNWSNYTGMSAVKKKGLCLCKEGLYDNGKPECGVCHYTCKTCGGPSKAECIICAGNRGSKNNTPIENECSCPFDTFDYLYPICYGKENASGTINFANGVKQEGLGSFGFFSAIGLNTLNYFGFLFKIVEVAQEIYLYSFLNFDKPLNLENLTDFFAEFNFFKHLSIFQKLQLPITNSSTKSEKSETKDQVPPLIFKKKGMTSSFLSNASSILLIIIFIPLGLVLILYISNIINERQKRRKTTMQPLQKKHKKKKKKTNWTILILIKKLWKKKLLILFNTILTLFLGSLQEVQFFFALQMMKISFSNLYNTFSFLFSILWIIYEIGILSYLLKIYLSMNPHIKKKIDIKRKISTMIKKRSTFFRHGPEKNINTGIPDKKESIIKVEYSSKQKEKFSFFFGLLIKENANGMSFLCYRISKKMILPLLHVFFHQDINQIIFYLIIFYLCSYLYLRIVDPYKYKILGVSAEVTELLHINFLFLIKFYVHALSLRHSETALTLGVYMIYCILAIISMNAFTLVVTICIHILTALMELIHKKKKEKRKSTEQRINQSLEMSLRIAQSQSTPMEVKSGVTNFKNIEIKQGFAKEEEIIQEEPLKVVLTQENEAQGDQTDRNIVSSAKGNNQSMLESFARLNESRDTGPKKSTNREILDNLGDSRVEDDISPDKFKVKDEFEKFYTEVMGNIKEVDLYFKKNQEKGSLN